MRNTTMPCGLQCSKARPLANRNAGNEARYPSWVPCKKAALDDWVARKQCCAPCGKATLGAVPCNTSWLGSNGPTPGAL